MTVAMKLLILFSAVAVMVSADPQTGNRNPQIQKGWFNGESRYPTLGDSPVAANTNYLKYKDRPNSSGHSRTEREAHHDGTDHPHHPMMPGMKPMPQKDDDTDTPTIIDDIDLRVPLSSMEEEPTSSLGQKYPTTTARLQKYETLRPSLPIHDEHQIGGQGGPPPNPFHNVPSYLNPRPGIGAPKRGGIAPYSPCMDTEGGVGECVPLVRCHSMFRATPFGKLMKEGVPLVTCALRGDEEPVGVCCPVYQFGPQTPEGPGVVPSVIGLRPGYGGPGGVVFPGFATNFDASGISATDFAHASEVSKQRVQQNIDFRKQLLDQGFGLQPGTPGAANNAFLRGNEEADAQAEIALHQIELTKLLQQQAGKRPRSRF